MAIQLIGKNEFPSYLAEASDIVSGSLAVGVGLIGKTIYTWDDGSWYIVVGTSGSSFVVSSYVQPALET
jgi:hypothetical protein